MALSAPSSPVYDALGVPAVDRRTVFFDRDAWQIVLTDQPALPDVFRRHRCKDVRETAFAIQTMVVRGAPAIGVTGAFGMVLAAYGLGRALGRWTPQLPRWLPYLLISALLLLSQTTVPPWFAVLLFVPIGILAAVSDAALVDRMTPLGDEPMRWRVLVRSGAVGGLVGSIGLGLICQVLGLSVALPLVTAGFIALAITQGRLAAQA